MGNLLNWLNGSKTYIVGIVGIIIAAVELVGIDVVPNIDQSSALTALWAAIGLITVRKGIKSATKP